MKLKIYLFSVFSFALFSCSIKQNSREKIEDLKYLGYYKIEGDSLIIPKFEIEVNLNKKAESKIITDSETIIVRAKFIGIPKDTTKLEFLKFGSIQVTEKNIELVKNRIAKFKDIKISKSAYESLSEKDIVLIINIFTGRKSSKYNLIHCDLLQDNMSKIKNKRFIIKGSLIGDNI